MFDPDGNPATGGPLRNLRATLTSALLLALAACGGDDTPSGNHPPHLQQVVAVPDVVARGGTVQLTALASDSDNDALTYTWRATGGTLGTPDNDGRVRWTAPQVAGVFRVTAVVRDASAADSAFTDIQVGNGLIHVESEPSGIPILLNGGFDGQLTPADIVVVPGDYTVRLASPDFVFAPADTEVTLADGGSVTTRFQLPAPRTEQVDTGGEAVDEIGGLTYSRLGIGVLYGARRGGETTLRSASLVPGHAAANGRVLLTGLNWDESLSLRSTQTGAELAFVRGDSVTLGQLSDPDQDGLMESLDAPRTIPGLNVRTYAPAFNPAGTKLAFSLNPSTQPNARDTTIVTDYSAGDLTNPAQLSSGLGNAPSLGPDDLAVYESSGEIFSVELPAGGFSFDPLQLTNSGRHGRAPALSPNGRIVAWIDDRGHLMLTLLRDGVTVRILSGVSSARVAWSPQGTELLIADQATAGNARLRLVTNLPLQR